MGTIAELLVWRNLVFSRQLCGSAEGWERLHCSDARGNDPLFHSVAFENQPAACSSHRIGSTILRGLG